MYWQCYYKQYIALSIKCECLIHVVSNKYYWRVSSMFSCALCYYALKHVQYAEIVYFPCNLVGIRPFLQSGECVITAIQTADEINFSFTLPKDLVEKIMCCRNEWMCTTATTDSCDDHIWYFCGVQLRLYRAVHIVSPFLVELCTVLSDSFIDGSKSHFFLWHLLRNFGAVSPGKHICDGCELSWKARTHV